MGEEYKEYEKLGRGEKLGAPRKMLLLKLLRAGFELFLACGIGLRVGPN